MHISVFVYDAHTEICILENLLNFFTILAEYLNFENFLGRQILLNGTYGLLSSIADSFSLFTVFLFISSHVRRILFRNLYFLFFHYKTTFSKLSEKFLMDQNNCYLSELDFI